MEIDFLIPDSKVTRRKHVSAIEVKSEKDYTTSSLDKFNRKYGKSITASYIIHPGDLCKREGVLYAPIYMTPWLFKWVDDIDQ